MNLRVAAVLAGDRVDSGWLRAWLSRADLIIAVDGGADHVLKAGFVPNVLVGDLDSVSAEGLRAAQEVVEVEDQNSSDGDKLVCLLNDRGLSPAVVLGSEGTRIDHMLGALHSMINLEGHATLAYRRQLVRVLVGPDTLAVACDGQISALPLDRCTGVTVEGVNWPVDHREMVPGGFTSLSNSASGVARISVGSGALAIFWNYDGDPIWPDLS